MKHGNRKHKLTKSCRSGRQTRRVRVHSLGPFPESLRLARVPFRRTLICCTDPRERAVAKIHRRPLSLHRRRGGAVPNCSRASGLVIRRHRCANAGRRFSGPLRSATANRERAAGNPPRCRRTTFT